MTHASFLRDQLFVINDTSVINDKGGEGERRTDVMQPSVRKQGERVRPYDKLVQFTITPIVR
ncbi:MAG TPA: hypothetical protein VKE96_14280 [Vicinamibacterales bacterium]|nr:hypothetical protein [Vicinamibacterales bacterium]